MKSYNEFKKQQNYILTSISETTLKEIIQVGRAAERKNHGYLDISSFGKLFGLLVPDSDIHIEMPVKLTYSNCKAIEQKVPLLVLSFDSKDNNEIKNFIAQLEDALSVKSFAYEDMSTIKKASEYYESYSNSRKEARPVVNYEGHLLRTDELRFTEKYAELKDQLDEDVVEFIENEIRNNGPTLFEDEIINNFARIMNLHQAKAADYNYAVMDAMEMHMQKGEKFGNVPKGFYECDMVYIDAIMNLYEQNLHEQELELELEM